MASESPELRFQLVDGVYVRFLHGYLLVGREGLELYAYHLGSSKEKHGSQSLARSGWCQPITRRSMASRFIKKTLVLRKTN